MNWSDIVRSFARGGRTPLRYRLPPINPFTIEEAETLIAAIHRDWGEAQGNYDEFRFFSGLRQSEQIALLVADYDRSHGTLQVTKSRTRRNDRDTTKTGESRIVELCPRAIAVLERQLAFRDRMKQSGRIDHDHLFVDRNGKPFVDIKNPYRRWRRTLSRLEIPYRKPYASRHSSVSWNLMIGRNPVRLAELHGHSPVTMLSIYTAWSKGTSEGDVEQIRRAIYLDETSPTPQG